MTIQVPHILIVEDDEDLADWLKEYLSSKGFKLSVSYTGEDALKIIKAENPDVVLLDGMLPGINGVDVCQAVRPHFTNAIIMVTAQDEEIDEVLGLKMGADDYLTKPIRARALLTRIEKYLAKQSAIKIVDKKNNDQQLTFNRLIIDKESRTVTLNNVKINISTYEFDVLWLLAQQAGTIVHREELVSKLRGFDYDGFDRSIDQRVSRLRKKLNDNPDEPYRIKTVWGKGYLFAKDAW